MSKDDEIANQQNPGKVDKFEDEIKTNHTRSEELTNFYEKPITQNNNASTPLSQVREILFEFLLYDRNENLYDLINDVQLKEFAYQRISSSICLQNLQCLIQEQLSPKFQYISINKVEGLFKIRRQMFYFNQLSEIQKTQAISKIIEGSTCQVFLLAEKKQIQKI